MESIHVPKGMTLLVDTENDVVDIPMVNAVIVEGKLIFASPIHPDNCAQFGD